LGEDSGTRQENWMKHIGCSEGMSEGEYQLSFVDYEGDLLHDEGGSGASLNQPLGFWRTRDGSMLKIAEMSTAHLKNAKSFFERLGWGEHPKIDELGDELDKRTP
jgi:hypothetical protein